MYAMFLYDIPDNLDVTNPSGYLRRLAVRINLSVWVMREDNVPHAYLAELTEEGVSWHLIPFAGVSADYVYGLCNLALNGECERIARSARRSILTAERTCRDTGDVERFRKRMRASTLRAARLLEDSRKAGSVFGIGLPITDLVRQVHALHVRALARSTAYLTMRDAVRGSEMEAAARAEDIPGPILADWIEDRSGESMEGLQELFRD